MIAFNLIYPTEILIVHEKIIESICMPLF